MPVVQQIVVNISAGQIAPDKNVTATVEWPKPFREVPMCWTASEHDRILVSYGSATTTSVLADMRNVSAISNATATKAIIYGYGVLA